MKIFNAMRLAIDVRSLMENRRSGVQEYTIQLIRSMLTVAPQHEYHLFYNSFRPVSLPDFSGNVFVHAAAYPNKLFNAAQLGFNQPTWDHLVPADCFFVPSLRLMPLAASVPLVTTVHDLSFERFPEFLTRRRRLWHRFMRPRFLMQNSDHLIAVSNATAADVHELYEIPKEKISVIYSGVTSAHHPTNPTRQAALKQSLDLPDRFVLYFGTLEPRKNIPSIIRAYSAIANETECDLVIAGAPGWLTQPIKEAVRVSSLAHRIHQPGFIAEDDKADLYAAADLFVYPSFYEGFGFPPLEAAAAGTPVITSRNAALPEVVGEWATLVDPYDVTELALVLREMLRQPQRLSLKMQEQITSRYSWDATARQTLEVIERVQ